MMRDGPSELNQRAGPSEQPRLATMLKRITRCPGDAKADLNQDGLLDTSDYLLFVDAFANAPK